MEKARQFLTEIIQEIGEVINWEKNKFLKIVGLLCFILFFVNCALIIASPNHGTQTTFKFIGSGAANKEALYKVVLIINPYVFENAFVMTFLLGLNYFIIFCFRFRNMQETERFLLTIILILILVMIIMGWLFVWAAGNFYSEDIWFSNLPVMRFFNGS